MSAFKIAVPFTLLVALGFVSTMWAADDHHGHADNSAVAKESGQSAFAAIAEIVAILEADPSVDWQQVDFSDLREHLVDMNALTLNANVQETPIDDGLTVKIDGSDRTKEAIQRMVPAHAAELDAMADWSALAEVSPDGARLTVTSADPDIQVKIRGLGFFGLMATGDHHQPHHLAIARGQPLHHH